MYYPTKRFLVLICLPGIVGMAFLLHPISREILLNQEETLWTFAILVNLSLISLFLVDAITIPGKRKFTIERQLVSTFSIDYPHPVQLLIDMKTRLRKRLRISLHEDLLEHMKTEDLATENILRKGRNTLHYKIRIADRGLYEQEYIYITAFSLIGLARKIYHIPCPSRIHVYPDLKAVSKYALLARRSRQGLMGMRKMRKTGGDNDFERLKEYTRGDEFRHIDWKATARSNELMVRTYQKTRNQNILFLLDCGRMMTSEHERQSLLDHALSSMLLLSYVALREKDRVGLLAFDSKVIRYVPPATGINHHKRLIQASYDLRASHQESNFDQAFQYLNKVCRKRSLLFLLTNINDDMNAGQLQSYLGSLAGRHLPFAVLLKQPEIEAYIEKSPEDNNEMFVQAAIADFLTWKEEVIQRLKNRSVLVLDSLPEHLNANLVNEYLRIKARNML